MGTADAPFLNRLSELRSRSKTLAAALRDSAQFLRNGSGLAETDDLVNDLRCFRSDFLALNAEQSTGIPIDNTSAADSLDEIEQRYEAHCSLKRMMSALDQLESAHLTDRRDQPHWERCVSDARLLRRELQDLPMAQAIARSTQFFSAAMPLGAVLQFIVQQNELSDERWWELNDSVVRAYGRELGAAIVRNRISIAPNSNTTTWSLPV